MRKKSIRIMNKIVIVIMLIFVSNILISCKNNKKTETKDSSSGFDIKAANNVADTYMKYLIKGDLENSKKLYSKELLKNLTSEESKNLKILGYNISEINEIGKSGLFKIKVTRSDLNGTFASLDEYSVKIAKEDTDYKIKETNNIVQKEAFSEGNQIRLKNKNNINTNLVIDMDGLPGYAFSRDDKSNIDKIKVPKSKLGIINFGYSGESLAISSYDKDVFIGIIKLDESLATQATEKKDGGGEEQDKQKEGGGSKAREKAIGKEIMPLDILKDCKLETMTFSPGEKFITVQYARPSMGKCIRIYKTDSGDIIPFKFEEKYPIDKVDVVFSSYDKENINFDVIPKKATDKSSSDVIGKWQLNSKDFKAKKM